MWPLVDILFAGYHMRNESCSSGYLERRSVMGIDWLLGIYAIFVTLAIVVLTRTRKTFGD